MKSIAVLILLVLSFSIIIQAATLTGVVYDFSLNKIENAKIEIDTDPKQIVVAKDGTYNLNIPIGDYMIMATHVEENGITSMYGENISIKDDGTYNLDIILFPKLDDLEKEPIVELGELEEPSNSPRILYIIAAGFGFIIGIIIFKKRKKKRPLTDEHTMQSLTQEHTRTEPAIQAETAEKRLPNEVADDLTTQVLAIIRKEGGRTTQKDIRKQIPMSEGKISLVISQLEHEDKIKKIKKGRGNILILK